MATPPASRISPFALVREIRSWFPGPLVLAGGIAHGSSVLAARAAGADLAYVGSAFLGSDEANVSDADEEMVVAGTSGDIVTRSGVTGIAANFPRGSFGNAGLDPECFDRDTDATWLAMADGSVARPWRDLWGAGHGISAVDRRGPVAETVHRLRREYDLARADLLA